MGNVASVGITLLNPADTNITLTWSSFDSTGALTPATTSANAYAVDPSGNKFSASSPVNGRMTTYSATVTGLTPGTTYACSCDADSVMSPSMPGTTTGASYTAHLLISKPNVDVKVGEEHHLHAKVVKINDPKETPLPGVTVYFAVTSGSQYGTLSSASAVSNARGMARIIVDAGHNPGDMQVTASSPSADNSGAITVHVKK